MLPAPHEGLMINVCQSLRLYRTHWKTFTRPLLGPVALQVLGVYGCLIFSYLAMDVMSTHFWGVFGQYPGLGFAVVLPIAFGMIYLFCQGFWQTLVYMASFNRNAQQVMAGKRPTFGLAYNEILEKTGPYTAYLLVMVGLQMLPVFLYGAILAAALALGAGPVATIFLLVGGTVVAAFSLLASLVAMIYLCLGFQVLAFEEVGRGFREIPRRSFSLVKGAFWRTAGLQLVWMLITTMIVPGAFVLLFQLSGLQGILNAFHGWTLELILSQAQPPVGWEPVPGYSDVYRTLLAYRGAVSESLSATLVSTVTTLLLLPLGTFSFTRLYLSRASESPS